MTFKICLLLIYLISFSNFIFGMQSKRVTLSGYRASQLTQPAPITSKQENPISNSNEIYTFLNNSNKTIKPTDSKIDATCFSIDEKSIIFSLLNGKIKQVNLESSNVTELYNSGARTEYVVDLHNYRLAMLLNQPGYNNLEICSLESVELKPFALNKRKLVGIYSSSDRSFLLLRYENLNEIEEKIYIIETNSTNLTQYELACLTQIDIIAIAPLYPAYLAIIDLVNNEYKLKIYDYSKCQKVIENDLDFKVNIMEFSRDGSALAMITDNNTLKILDLSTKEICSFTFENLNTIHSIKFLPNQIPHDKDNCILIIFSNGTMKLCDLKNNKILHKTTLSHLRNGKRLSSISLSNSGQYLSVIIERGRANKIKIFDLTKMVKKTDTIIV